MSSRGRSSAVLGIIVGAVLALGAAMPAMAEDPVDFGQSPIVDTVGALSGSTAEVEAAIDRAADASGRQLFVAYVDEFTNPEAADAWANDTAIGTPLSSPARRKTSLDDAGHAARIPSTHTASSAAACEESPRAR